MERYAIIQSKTFIAGKNHRIAFDIIKGERAPGGYPVGYEGLDWFRTEHKDLSIEAAQEILETLNK